MCLYIVFIIEILTHREKHCFFNFDNIKRNSQEYLLCGDDELLYVIVNVGRNLLKMVCVQNKILA